MKKLLTLALACTIASQTVAIEPAVQTVENEQSQEESAVANRKKSISAARCIAGSLAFLSMGASFFAAYNPVEACAMVDKVYPVFGKLPEGFKLDTFNFAVLNFLGAVSLYALVEQVYLGIKDYKESTNPDEQATEAATQEGA